MIRIIPIAAFFIFCIAACTQKSYEKIDNGIMVHVDEGHQHVKLQAITDKIVRVTVTPGDPFDTTESLMIVQHRQQPSRWEVEEGDGSVTLITPVLKAMVSTKTGEITFTDSTGKILLKEKRKGRTFKSLTIDGKNYYSLQQKFESPADEAFYGLGGHQNGQMNYKGEDVELVQHNIVDVIPFLYSNKNYGILWDNYSITKFGDPRDYQPLSSLTLSSRTGEPGGLTTEYYEGDKIVKSTVENKIDYEFLETTQVDSFPKRIANQGKIIWEGSFSSDKEGSHKFLVYSSGYVKVWVDGELIMDKWRQNWNPWSNKFTVDVQKGEKHNLKIEWIPQGGYFAVKHLDPLEKEEQDELSLYSEVGHQIDYYFVSGSNADEVISGYRTLTGKATMMPNWAMGFWQSRERYKTQQELVDVVKEFRKRRIPLDNIVLDWFYWEEDKWGSHQFDAARFPDPKKMVDELHSMNTQLMISVWPKFYPGTDNFNALNEKGFLFTRNLEKKRKDWVGPGYENTFYDAFNPEARKLFWSQIDKNLNSLGIDAWWMDATEPDMHSNLSIEERKLNMHPTKLGSGAHYFNAYSLVNSKAIYEGERQSDPDKRVFILTRSAYAGQQRYASVTWSGDIVSRWSDFKDQIATGVNFSLSGIPYWTMDIGGFSLENRYVNPNAQNLDEWRELNTRWYQFGAFCPIFRVHGQYPFREIFNIAPENHPAYQSMLYYNKLRYRLMPYIYSLVGHTYHEDYTIMRGLVMDFGSDKNVLEINDQYLFGPSLLINPVHAYKARNREVYLPAATGWYDVYTGKHYEGGQQITAEAPLTTIPLYVKEGSIIPMGPEIQFVNEKPADTITLYVYAGKDGAFELYEDEGVNYNYENEKFAIISIDYEESSGTLTLGDRRGSFAGLLDQRTFNIVVVKKEQAISIDSKSAPQHQIHYSGKRVQVKI